ncbi:hypothetical protein, partial [Mesorhizobium sp.]|uniref:hypothetical protein n=1 Tax=Mesorhizobium sp. TaxID=1871066 RepID=UPI0025E8D73E
TPLIRRLRRHLLPQGEKDARLTITPFCSLFVHIYQQLRMCGRMETTATILHADLDAFYASVSR